MRKQIDGLSRLVEQGMSKKLFTGDLFLFCGREMTMIKALYWDRNGFCLWVKRVERGTFPWPQSGQNADDTATLTEDELGMILEGIDFRKRFTTLEYSHIA
jgi:transposase